MGCRAAAEKKSTSRIAQRGSEADTIRPSTKLWLSVIVPIFGAPFPDAPNDYASAKTPDRNAGFSPIGPPLLVWLECK
jgi:hypothetical protein